MRALLVGPRIDGKALGEFARGFGYSATKDLGIAVDGGLRAWVQAGLEPRIAIGDWDSLGDCAETRKWRARVATLSLPKAKDRSDLYYACQTAIEQGATELHCVGVSGGRPDQQLGVLMDLSDFEATTAALRSVRTYAEDADTRFVSERNSPLSFQTRKKQCVSIFALGESARALKLTGLRFQPKNGILRPSSHGLSNEATGTRARIAFKHGRLVVMALKLAKSDEIP